MYRLVYRNFGDHESLVVNHTVGTEDGSAAPRWYEVRNPGASPVIYQQGTYAPDASFRWMGSMAMDGHGNIALGYSKSSSTMYPSIGITGRLAGDPLGTMGAEDVWFAGGGSQVASSSRWGDYSTMSIDPVDDCTFWYTQEYYAETGELRLQDADRRLPVCELHGRPFRNARGHGDGRLGPPRGRDRDGGAAFPCDRRVRDDDRRCRALPVLDAAGRHLRRHGLEVRLHAVDGRRRRRSPPEQTPSRTSRSRRAPTSLVNGTVKDGSGHGWPLYARLVVSGPERITRARRCSPTR